MELFGKTKYMKRRERQRQTDRERERERETTQRETQTERQTDIQNSMGYFPLGKTIFFPPLYV